jgi:hyperosmotically inducible periplasmic protein
MDARSRMRMTILAALVAGPFLAGCGDRSTNSAGARLDRSMDKIASATQAGAADAAASVDDAAITAKVKAAVLAEPGLRTLQIDVDTNDGVVTLSGVVDSPALKERAAQVAQGVGGVRSVRDNLAIKSAG